MKIYVILHTIVLPEVLAAQKMYLGSSVLQVKRVIVNSRNTLIENRPQFKSHLLKLIYLKCHIIKSCFQIGNLFLFNIPA